MANETDFDVIVAGKGPAGIQAAIHAARKKAGVLLLGRGEKSSLYWAHVENFCCMAKVTGEELLRTGRDQARKFGAELLKQDILDVALEDGAVALTIEDGRRLTSRALVVATGTTRNKLGVPGEKELLGRGVSYCADCDAGFYRGREVVMVGGGSAAAGGAMTLAKYASGVRLICGKLDIDEAMADRLAQSPVELLEGRSVKAILGRDEVEGVALDDGSELPCAGVFIELGAKGVMELAMGLGLPLDDDMKHIVADKKQFTGVPGVFAAGDICGPPYQMAKAVGEGCVAGIEAANYAKRAAGEA